MADSSDNTITGTARSELIVGTDENETIDGGGGFDIVDGSGGNDSIKGGDSHVLDEFFGRANHLLGGSGNDTVEGGESFDFIDGGSGNDLLTGGGGNDLIRGGSGNDTIKGGEGNDDLVGDSGDDSIEGGAGDDWMSGGEGDDVLDGGAGNDTLVAGEGNDTLTGGEGEDVFVLTDKDGTTTITDFDVDNDKLFIGTLTNTPTLAELLAAMTEFDSDNDGTADGVTIDLSSYGGGTITLQGVTLEDLKDGQALNAALFDFGHETIEGTADDEFFYGGVGNDTLTGGGGNDTFRFADNHGDDTITDFDVDNDRIDLRGLTTAINAAQLLAAMTDLPDSDNDGTADGVVIDLSSYGGGTITLQGVTKADLMVSGSLNVALFDLPDGTANVTWTGTDDSDGVSGGEAGLTFKAKDGGDLVYAGEGNDTIGGADGDDWLFGMEGNDSILGGAGDDMILGGEGDDYIDGGDDDDYIRGGEGNDTILGGEGNDFIRGEAGDDSIEGGAGNDRIYGGEGNDTIDGGAGNDWIRGDAGDDSITGGIGDDSIGGNEGNDTIDGGAGDDFIYGGEGDDSLTGGADTDTFVFGEGHGNDTITDFVDGTDLIDLSALGITNFAALSIADDGNGNAVITTSTGNTITLTGVATADLDASNFVFDTTGTGGNDTIDGSVRDDVMVGYGGDDSLTGGAGADTFVFGTGHGNDTITDFTDGTDLIDLSALGSMNFDALTISDDGNGNAVITTSAGNTITLTGVAAADLDASNFVFDTRGTSGNDTIDGSVLDDVIVGFAGDDSLTGRAGEDLIIGGEGNDSMTGGAGADTFMFGAGHGNDTITDFEDGTDVIDLSALDGITQFDDLTIADDGNGNVVITTSTGDTITLTGVSSEDLDADDFVFSTTGDDTDNTIEGGDGADNLEGLGGNDSLSGGAGEDWLDGGAGNDVLTGGADADVFVFEAGHGNDTITDFEDGTDIIDLSALDGITQFNDLTIADDGNGNVVITTSTGNTITLTGVSSEDLDADDFVFSTTGDDTDNTIEGGGWIDRIEGLGGNDSLTGGTGPDTFVFGTGHGNDTISDFTDDWDSIDLSGITTVTQLSDLTFTSSDGGVLINTGQGTILLEGVQLEDLDEEDFVFYEPPVDDGM